MIKTLLRSLREYKRGSILTILLSVLEAAFEILIPLRMADLIDQGIDLGNMAAVWKFGIAILIFAALQLLTGVLSAHIAAKTSVGFSANLRQDMYDNVQTFAFSNIDKFSTASIVTRLTTDVTNIQNAYQMMLRMAVRGPVTVLKGDGSGLSQGQRQLISIARAAVSDPPVMILDEATSSIDTRTEALVQGGMDKLMKGRTVFVIANRLSTVQNSDVIMVLDHGHIIERGDHEKLIAEKGTYYQLYTGAFELD